jgi:signal peptidase I
MAPNILKGTWYWHTQSDQYDVGDIVVLTDPHSDSTRIRRVVAISGDRIHIHNDGIVVNDRRLPQLDMRHWNDDARVWQELSTNTDGEVTWEYIQSNTASNFQTDEITIPTEQVFLMCDNRAECLDSRWWGPISTDRIQGKITFSLCLFCNDGIK